MNKLSSDCVVWSFYGATMGQVGHMEVLSVSQMKTSEISCLRGRFHLESQPVFVDHHLPTVSSVKTTSVQHMGV